MKQRREGGREGGGGGGREEGRETVCTMRKEGEEHKEGGVMFPSSDPRLQLTQLITSALWLLLDWRRHSTACTGTRPRNLTSEFSHSRCRV